MTEHARQIDPGSIPAQTAAVHRFALEYTKRDGTLLGRVALESEFECAREWTRFIGIRKGMVDALGPVDNEIITPLYCEERGEPYCLGFQIKIEPGAAIAEPVVCDFPTDFFEAEATAFVLKWIESGALASGEPYTFQLCAFAVPAERAGAPPSRASNHPVAPDVTSFEIEALPTVLPFEESRLDDFLERSVRVGPAREDAPADEIPVFMATTILEEVTAIATAAGDQESGGALIGYLHRDPTTPEAFIEITAQIPARHAEATSTSFSFSPATWSAVDAAIDLRAREEQILGWYHSHPLFCHPECPESRWASCLFARPFFSADDLNLHRVCFGLPYQVALLISDLPASGQTPALFGWQTGRIAARGHFLIP